MQATMMNYPLTITHILERAGKVFRSTEIVSRLPDRSLHRYTYADFHRRARSLAQALVGRGLRRGDRVATLMWNHYAHIEAYFGIPAAGGVLHTLNLRLHPDEIAYIVNHAQDRFLIVDETLLPLYEKFKSQVSLEKVFVVRLSGEAAPQGYEDYEAMLAAGAGEPFVYPEIAEDEACGMCYTSGTTGHPKGVVYSHRSSVLHAFAAALPDAMSLSSQETVLPVVPMFHANAWGIPYAAIMVGTKIVFPGPHLDAESLLDLFQREAITLAAGVPTVWLGILPALEQHPGKWKIPEGMRMLSGGSAVPESMIRAFSAHGMEMIQAWGMTETSPLAALSYLKPGIRKLSQDRQFGYRARQGIPIPFVDLRIVGDEGEAPWDGKAVGEIQVRGPCVTASYHELPVAEDKFTADGWLRTGDVATVDGEGYIKITDRTKDLIKSGGEWISSVDLENAIMGHPAVQEAAVIAVSHPKWAERPLAVIVLKPGQKAGAEEIRDHLAQHFAKWQIPDGYAFVESIPRTSTGKFLKTKLREQFSNWRWE